MDEEGRDGWIDGGRKGDGGGRNGEMMNGGSLERGRGALFPIRMSSDH